MMASAGVSVGGGAGMLRTRRRDVSVKPNRKLDRKSSRGMIYENEELRLRTIHINAEVEQGQNDIKKLRRENEQLRREIWSLRDEYDKLEEILKRQKNRDESEEYEDRSEDDEAPCSSNSCEEDEELEEEEEEEEDEEGNDRNQDERLENAENQKISSEKMNGSGLHRLHVDFDDLSVVDEEEELKKEKEKKESISSDGQNRIDESGNPLLSIGPRQLHENIPFYPANYQPPSAFTDTSYYAECPFEFSSGFDPIMSTDTPTLLASSCPRIYADPMMPLTALDPTSLGRTNDRILPRLHVPPVGWQNNVVIPGRQTPNYAPANPVVSNPASTTLPVLGSFTPTYPDSVEDYRALDVPMSSTGLPFQSSTIPLRRNVNLRQATKSGSANVFDNSLANTTSGVGTVLGSPKRENNTASDQTIDRRNLDTNLVNTSQEKPRHFFAPLPSKLKKQEEESPTTSTTYFGTGTSSSSGKTGSTVICKGNQFGSSKGSADVCVNGAVSYGNNARFDKDDQKTFLSIDNLLIGENKNNNQLTKSMSCQDLTSDSQNICISEQLKMNHADVKLQLTKSDNTLDNVSSNTTRRPYKSHLNVTLKMPRLNQTPSPETPEIPKLPSIDYRLFKNPFLRKFEQDRCNFPDQNSPVTRPLSIQVNENTHQQYRNPTTTTGYERGFHFDDKYIDPRTQIDQSRLLIPSDQLINGKIVSPINKQDIQVTSFEKPSPHALLPSAIPYDLNTLRKMTTNRYYQNQNLYQNVPFVPGGPNLYQRAPIRMYYDTIAKVPAQTQTSIDGDSHHEDDRCHQDDENASASNSPSGQRRKKAMKKEKPCTKDQKPLSPAAQRRLRKQSSATSSEVPDSPCKSSRHRPRRLSGTTTTTSDAPEDKNESRSSSSGQDSPRKDQARRVSIYFNAKKRPSLTSVKTTRSSSLDTSKDVSKDKYIDGNTNLDRERTNSVSSREMASGKTRKTSTSSGNVPWCACWGNGCI